MLLKGIVTGLNIEVGEDLGLRVVGQTTKELAIRHLIKGGPKEELNWSFSTGLRLTKDQMNFDVISLETS